VEKSVKMLYLWGNKGGGGGKKGGEKRGGEKQGGDSRAHCSESSWDVKLYFSSLA
jgi:hypothetical protein